MMRKKILISAAIVVGIAGLVLAGLYIAILVQPKKEVAKETPAGPDVSKDYKACTILEKSFIKTTLGSAADNLQGPDNNGVINSKKVGDGMDNLVFDSQACVYAFIAGGTFENGFNSNNALNIAVTKYTNDTGPAAFIEAIRTEPGIDEIKGIGDNAFYSSNTVATGPGAMYSFKLQVFTGNTLVDYTIRQPAESASFTSDTAKTALEALAQVAKPIQ